MESGDSDCEIVFEDNKVDDCSVVYSTTQESFGSPEEEDIQMVDTDDDEETVQDEADSFEVISAEKIAEEMDGYTSEVSSIINISKTHTRILLNHFKWDKEKLMERYYGGDQGKLFEEAHMINPFDISKLNRSLNPMKECQVCFTTVVSSEMAGLPCGHLYCTDCWENYLKAKITSEGESDSITCVDYTCDILVDDETVMHILKDSKDKTKYQRLITSSFVESNKLFRWCPSPGCNNVIKVSSTKPKMIKCKCNHVFCFACGDSWHDPINCECLRKWKKQCQEDSATLQWLNTNTKDCPVCKSAIEKNGGCNHMTCRKCKYEFCWICLCKYNGHGNCNMYVPQAKEKSRVGLEMFMFYRDRHLSHQQSLKLEGQLYVMAQLKMKELIEAHGLSWIEVQYLKDAVDVLQSCRQTLSYTYIFAYYVKKTNQVLIFEENQHDLHNAVERFSDYLERRVGEEDFSNLKKKVMDLCHYCEDRRKKLLKHIHEGVENNWWFFDD